MAGPFDRTASRRNHLGSDNLLRSLTREVDDIPDGINLGQGVCDLDLPSPIATGAAESIAGADRQTYTHYSGTDGLKEAVADKLRRHNHLDYDLDRIMISTGSSGAFSAAVVTLLEPGDEVVLFEPFYAYHPSTLLLAGAVPVPVPFAADGAVDIDALRDALTPRTRAVMINTPVNPSGKVFTTAELEAIGAVLDGTDVVVFTDEVYEYMVFDDRRHVSPATIPSLAERTLTMSSFSKTFSITGWRVGYLAGPADIVGDIGRVFDQLTICAPRPLQRGVERALRELPDSFYDELRVGYQQRRARMISALTAAGFRAPNPEGGYYAFAEYSAVFGDIGSEAAVRTMIDRIGVNAVPGQLFHRSGADPRTIRFHFAVDDIVLDEVCRRLESLAN